MLKRKKPPAEHREGMLYFIVTIPCTGGQRNTTGEHGP